MLSEGKLCSDNPDEVALLYGIRELGSVIVQKSDETVVLRMNGGEAEEWKLLRVNAFSSERKCMSVVAKNEKHGVIRVYVKVCVFEWSDAQGAEECVLAECDEKESEVSRLDSQQSYKLDNASEWSYCDRPRGRETRRGGVWGRESPLDAESWCWRCAVSPRRSGPRSTMP